MLSLRGTRRAVARAIPIQELAGGVPVAVFPSDHFLSDDHVFTAYVEAALDLVRQRDDLVVLLGVEAPHPETEYGWIEPSPEPLALDGEPAFTIRRFREKPSARVAETLLGLGCLWNSFVMVGFTHAFVNLYRKALPGLLTAFEPLRSTPGTPAEAAEADRLYRVLSEINFSDRVLAVAVERLATVRAKGVDWSDWGNADRVVTSLARAGRRPAWLSRVGLASTA